MFLHMLHLCLLILTNFRYGEAGLADKSVVLSTFKEAMDEDGKPMTNAATKLGMSRVADNAAFQTAEGMGMMVANQMPPVKAARTVYNGARMAGSMVKGMVTSGMGK